jgi:hypothetical protein
MLSPERHNSNLDKSELEAMGRLFHLSELRKWSGRDNSGMLKNDEFSRKRIKSWADRHRTKAAWLLVNKTLSQWHLLTNVIERFRMAYRKRRFRTTLSVSMHDMWIHDKFSFDSLDVSDPIVILSIGSLLDLQHMRRFVIYPEDVTVKNGALSIISCTSTVEQPDNSTLADENGFVAHVCISRKWLWPDAHETLRKFQFSTFPIQ